MIDQQFFRIPEGMVDRLEKEPKYYPYQFPQLNLTGIKDKDVYKDERTRVALMYYSVILQNRIRYLSHFKQDSLAQDLAQRYKDIL